MITVKTRDEFLYQVNEAIPFPDNLVEIGCNRGDFSEKVLFILNTANLYLIDSFENGGNKYGTGMNNISTSYSGKVDYLFAINRFFDNRLVKIIKGFSFDVVKGFPDGIFDFIYHDASHLYEDLKRDLKEWLPKLKAGGIMAGHDYIEHPDFGVIKAVDEFCKENNFEMIIYNENGGDYALKCTQ